MPLFLKLVGHGHLAIDLQLAISVLCWLFLAYQVGTLTRRRAVRLAAFAGTLLLSLSPEVIQWDGLLLSESLSLSLGAAVLGCCIWFARSLGLVALAVAAALSFLWAFTRDANAFLVVAAALPCAIAWIAGRRQARLLVAAILAVAILVLDLMSVPGSGMADARRQILGEPTAAHVDSPSVRKALVRRREYHLLVSPRWEFPLINILGTRVLTDHGRLEYFARHRMPTPAALLQRRGQYASDRGGAFFTDPRLVAVRRWVHGSGRSTYLGYILAHPLYVFESLRGGVSEMLFPPRDLVFGGGGPESKSPPEARVSTVLPAPVQSVVLDRTAACAAFWLAIVAAVAFLIVTRKPSAAWLVPITFVLAAPFEGAALWLGDAQSMIRHGVTLAVFSRAALIALLVAAVGSRRRANVRRIASPAA
jgi:hypothetical protein